MANSANIIFGIDTDVSCASDASWLASNAVGVYGSGAVCAAMRAGCASYAWLSQSGAYTGTPTFADWAIRQYCTTSLWVTSDPSDQLSVDLDCARAS